MGNAGQLAGTALPPSGAALGADIDVVQAFLGPASVATTTAYLARPGRGQAPKRWRPSSSPPEARLIDSARGQRNSGHRQRVEYPSGT